MIVIVIIYRNYLNLQNCKFSNIIFNLTITNIFDKIAKSKISITKTHCCKSETWVTQSIFISQNMTQRKGTAKLDNLLELEKAIQKRWEENKVFEIDAPPEGADWLVSGCLSS